MDDESDFDIFAPLTAQELAAVAAASEQIDDGEHVSPVPAEAPEAPERHPHLGKPTMRWTYRDAQGRRLPRPTVTECFVRPTHRDQ
jgi:hypothetical protein